jgi:hypothetical protein
MHTGFNFDAKERTMEITITRTGGFTGIPEKLGPINTDSLAKDTARQVSDIIAKMDFFNLPADIAKAGGADVFDYDTTVTDGGRTHTVHSNDNSAATYKSQLDELIKLLESSGATFKPAPAGTGEKAAPNRYELSGVGEREGEGMAGIPASYEIVYTVDALEIDTQIGGGSHAIVHDTFKQNELRVVAVDELGTCVSFGGGKSSDRPSTANTLVIPNILLDPDAGAAPVDGLLIDTHHPSPGGPLLPKEEHYFTVVKLTGTATRERP